MSFFAELRRRHVIRVGGLYVVTAWLLVQIADTLLPIFHTPDWVLQAMVVLLALGFIPALVFSWAFELTPEGLKRDQDVAVTHAVSTQKAKRLDVLTLAAVGLVVALFAADRFWPKSESIPADSDIATGTGALPVPSLTSTATDRRSIAVLPFVNMSSDPENEHFADGMSEELLNILAGIEGLKVASRTSAFSFKGKDTPIPEIARQLDVHHVLEGSVRKQGNRVKVTAQLIEAGSDAHLWTQTYQRDLDDIFLVQEEIAGAITTALEGILGAQRVKVDAPTRDMAAYQRYLHGRSRFYRRMELDQAMEDLRFAVERDPQFADAWAFLAATYWMIGNTGYSTSYERAEISVLASPAVDRAMALKPDNPIAVALKGRLILDGDTPGRVAEGLRLMERAVALPSPDTTPKLWLSLVWLELGQIDRVLPLMESARRLEPLVGINSGMLGLAHAIEGRRDEGVKLVLEAVRLDGLAVWANLLVVDRVNQGDQTGAVELVAAMLPLYSDAFASDRELSSRLLAVLQEPEGGPDDPELSGRAIADTHALTSSLMFDRGARAFARVESGGAYPWVIIHAAWLPAMRWLREDPRYFRLMQARGRVEYWDAFGYPRGCQPVDGPDGRHLACPEGV